MEYILDQIFKFVECPNLKLKKPSWLQMPSPMTVFTFLLVTYFLVTGGSLF